jgi:hypothetical protein
MSSRLWIGMLMFYILAIVICNVIEGAQMTTGISTDLDYMTAHDTTKSTDTAGNLANFITLGPDALGTFGKVIFFDYSMFKDMNNLDPVTGKPMANDFAIFRYLLIAIGVIMIVELVIVLRQIISK